MTDHPPAVSPTPSPGPAGRWAAGADRDLSITVGDARTALLQAIRALGFTTTSEQYSLLEAERGSKLWGFTLTRSRVPVSLRISLAPEEPGCRVEMRVEDRWGSTGRTLAAVAVYADVFTEMLTVLDERLKRADPKADFPFWWRTLPEHEAAAGALSAGSAARLEAVMQRRTSRILDGPRKGPTAAVAASGVRLVAFRAPGSVAEIEPEIVDGMLTAGQLVAGSPGTMPAKLVTHLQGMVVALEERLAATRNGGDAGQLEIEVTAADRPVLTFLYQQAALREKLPLRLLFRCTTCRLQKIVNPDLVRMRERNRRVKVLQTSVGAVFGAHQVSPFILVGRLAQLKNTDPDYVCARCQGTDADEKPITFCPRCGEQCSESVLRTCAKCSFDLRTLLSGATVWREVDATPPAGPEPAEAAAVDEVVAPAGPPADRWDPPQIDSPGPSIPPPLPIGWYPDPWHRFEVRFWDGAQWTMQVGSRGVSMIDTPPAPS